jgi:hypothetical protein
VRRNNPGQRLSDLQAAVEKYRINVTHEAPKPQGDPTLGVNVTPPDRGGATHRIVSIGDSLTQGFQSLAISKTHLSYPSLIARELGWFSDYRYPSYRGYGGLPLNMEVAVRELARMYGRTTGLKKVPAIVWLALWLRRTAKWWNSMAARDWREPSNLNHDLAVFAYKVRDAIDITKSQVLSAAASTRSKAFGFSTRDPVDRAAVRVFSGAGADMSLVDIATALGNNGGVETLTLALGANNVLNVVIDLKLDWADSSMNRSELQGKNVWSPELFASDWAALMAKVKSVNAKHVIVGNVPHVTIAPILAGVGNRISNSSRYYEYYTHAWLRQGFKTRSDPILLGDEARVVDSLIDMYNETIAATVVEMRESGRDWYLFDMCALLDGMAYRRYGNAKAEGFGAAVPSWWKPYQLPTPLDTLSPPPDSRFFTSGPQGRSQGGLFALDGVHPTTIGYGIIAQEILNIMHRADVQFEKSGVVVPGAPQIDFANLLSIDSLMSAPPTTIEEDLGIIRTINRVVDIAEKLTKEALP